MKRSLPLALGVVLAIAFAGAGCDDDDTPSGKADGAAGAGGGGAGGGPGGSDGGAGAGGSPGDGGPGTDTPVTTDGNKPPTDGGPGPVPSVKKEIGPEGGDITIHNGRLTVRFPRGALAGPREIELSVNPTPPGGAIGAVYDIEPAEERLNRPAIIIFKYTSADAPNTVLANEFRIGRFDLNHWNDQAGNRVDAAKAIITADLARLGTVGLLAGLCRLCTTTCDPATCKIGNDQGRCFDYGNGCKKCVALCDADGDGFCTGGHPGDNRSDLDDTNINVSPESPEICGNGKDDNSDLFIDEGCTPCAGDTDCKIGRQACIAGVCNVCPQNCDQGNCRFGGDGMANPGIEGRCHAYGVGCSVCVPDCDVDGDGYCPQPDPGMGRMGGDCLDNNRYAYPNAPEVCGNGLDDDCNGFADDKCQACEAGNECKAGFDCLNGACEGCTTTCDAATCRFRANDADPGVEGVCVTYGSNCSRCAPKCDIDGDGYCMGNPDNGQPGGDCADDDATVYPGSGKPELCGNDKDDNCNGHVNEGCKPCGNDSDCNVGAQACLDGVCDVCRTNCDSATCRFGAVDGVGGVAGKCFEYGKGCRKCVPSCDEDGDGFCPGETVMEQKGGDCQPNDPKGNPDAPEICGNMLDDDCDNLIDETCASCSTGAMCAPQESCSNQR